MKNKAKNLRNVFQKDEFKILIEKGKDGFNVHLSLGDDFNKTFSQIKAYQIDSPFGNDADEFRAD
jgi:hypothetical protein